LEHEHQRYDARGKFMPIYGTLKIYRNKKAELYYIKFDCTSLIGYQETWQKFEHDKPEGAGGDIWMQKYCTDVLAPPIAGFNAYAWITYPKDFTRGYMANYWNYDAAGEFDFDSIIIYPPWTSASNQDKQQGNPVVWKKGKDKKTIDAFWHILAP
jgi:hypothetical protein